MYTEWIVGDHSYKLRLTTQGVIQLEQALGSNPLQIFMGIDEDVLPKMGDLMTVLHRMLQPYNHGISLTDTYEIFDEYIKDGHTVWDIVPVIIEVYKDAGFLPKDEADSKN